MSYATKTNEIIHKIEQIDNVVTKWAYIQIIKVRAEQDNDSEAKAYLNSISK